MLYKLTTVDGNAVVVNSSVVAYAIWSETKRFTTIGFVCGGSISVLEHPYDCFSPDNLVNKNE